MRDLRSTPSAVPRDGGSRGSSWSATHIAVSIPRTGSATHLEENTASLELAHRLEPSHLSILAGVATAPGGY